MERGAEYTDEEQILALKTLIAALSKKSQAENDDLLAAVVDKCNGTQRDVTEALGSHAIPELEIRSGYSGLQSFLEAMSQYEQEQVAELYKSLLLELAKQHMGPVIAQQLKLRSHALSMLDLNFGHIEIPLAREQGKVRNEVEAQIKELEINANHNTVFYLCGIIVALLSYVGVAEATSLAMYVVSIIFGTSGALGPVLASMVKSKLIGSEIANLKKERDSTVAQLEREHPADAVIKAWNSHTYDAKSSAISAEDTDALHKLLLDYARMKILGDAIYEQIKANAQPKLIEDKPGVSVSDLILQLRLAGETAREMNTLPQVSTGPSEARLAAEAEVEEGLARAQGTLYAPFQKLRS